MTKPKILFVGKGGAKEGMGHLVRIATLIETIKPHFQVNVLTQHDRFGEFFFKQQEIACSTYKDNRQLFRFLDTQGKFSAIVIDIYRISLEVVQKIAGYCDFLINFDDMQRRVTKIDQSFDRFSGTFICPQEPFNRNIENRGKVTIAGGTDYFPLRNEFLEYREKKTFSPDTKKVGLILGGVPTKERVTTLTRLMDSALAPDIQVEVVLGYEPTELDQTQYSPRIHFIKNVDHMARLITRLDIGIIAGGFIKFEFLCIGTPFGMISLCAHQEHLARKYASGGYGVYFGKINDILANPQKFTSKLNAFLQNNSLREEMFYNARRLVDGRGSSRILEILDRFNIGEN